METVPLPFTLELEGPRKFLWMNEPSWSHIWHAMDNVSWSTRFASSLPQRGGSDTKPGDCDTSKSHHNS